jgi:hypothetical protein
MSTLLQSQSTASRAGDPAQRQSALGVDYVEVADEPLHVERFRNQHVRVYFVTLVPGVVSLYHRHRENTLYIVIKGGVCRSDEPGRQKQRIPGVGRSTRLRSKLSLAVQKLIFGSTNVPPSSVVMQYHAEFPLIHRVCAAASNAHAMELVGIEVFRSPRSLLNAPQAFVQSRLSARSLQGFELEFRDRQLAVHRIRLAPGARTGPRRLGPPSALVIVAGAATWSSTPGWEAVRTLEQGAVQWLDADALLQLVNPREVELEALLITLH